MAWEINKLLRIIVIQITICFFVLGCSIGTSFKSTQIKSFKGTLIPELSNEPILIEKVSIDLVKKEQRKTSLNLPLNLLNYNPESYKVGFGDILFIYVYGETERLSAALAGGAKINPIFEKVVRDDGTIFYPNAGILEVAGKTVEEIRLILTDSLSGVLNNPQVDVSVAEFNSQKIVFSGSFQILVHFQSQQFQLHLPKQFQNANPYWRKWTKTIRRHYLHKIY